MVQRFRRVIAVPFLFKSQSNKKLKRKFQNFAETGIEKGVENC